MNTKRYLDVIGDHHHHQQQQQQHHNQCIPQEQNLTDMNLRTGAYDYGYNQPLCNVYNRYPKYLTNCYPVIGLNNVNGSPVFNSSINTAAPPQQQQQQMQPSYVFQIIPSYIMIQISHFLITRPVNQSNNNQY